MKYPKILVGCPTYEGKDYALDKWVKNVQRLNYPNLQWCIVDNSRKPAYSNRLKRKYPGHIYHVNRGRNSRDGVERSSNFIRKKAINEGYDYVLMIEIDLYPPEDTVWRLLRHGKKVTGLPYEIGFKQDRGLCVFIAEKQKDGLVRTRRINKKEEHSFMDGSLQRVHGMGVGCVLIKKDILEKYPFWYSALDDKRMEGEHVRKHPDVYFYLDLHNDGVPVFCDTSVLVHHENSDWHKVKDV